ncbi:hypothetical protein ACFFJB_03195 [Camelimonas abortus]|uniref:Uncharacterized protein n=1 Tax=Camelimonas abortus TaxID=1017184 RepID=A0ABV7LGG8_9HYPH
MLGYPALDVVVDMTDGFFRSGYAAQGGRRWRHVTHENPSLNPASSFFFVGSDIVAATGRICNRPAVRPPA